MQSHLVGIVEEHPKDSNGIISNKKETLTAERSVVQTHGKQAWNGFDRTSTGSLGEDYGTSMHPAWSETSLASGISVTEAIAHVFAADVGVSLQNETVRYLKFFLNLFNLTQDSLGWPAVGTKITTFICSSCLFDFISLDIPINNSSVHFSLKVDAIHYDDANQLLMVTKGGSIVFAYDLTMDAPGHHEQLVWTYPVQVLIPHCLANFHDSKLSITSLSPGGALGNHDALFSR